MTSYVEPDVAWRASCSTEETMDSPVGAVNRKSKDDGADSEEDKTTSASHSISRSFCLRSPPPSQHLKKILANYPEGPQIFKEALQNADDAGARTFSILLDERNAIGQDAQRMLLPQRLRRFMGPSVIFVNDALFKEEDWQALQNMFESGKANTPGKIGRFGMGSRSYFHMADVVTILSGHLFAFLDPDWTITQDGGAAENLSAIKAHSDHKVLDASNSANLSNLHALLVPLFGVMGFSRNDTFYNGTLIRLPLRQGRWARTSSFAPYEYTPEKINYMLSRFQQEASQCLLFLQSMEQIQLWRWRDCDDQPFEMCSFRLHSNALTKEGVQKSISGHPRSAIRDFFEEQRRCGNDLQASMSQADTGHLPEIEDVFTTQQIEYVDRQQNEGLLETRTTLSFWVINIRLVSHSDLVALLPFTRCPPIVGIALRVGPPITRRTRHAQDPLPNSTRKQLASPLLQKPCPSKLYCETTNDSPQRRQKLLRSSPVRPEGNNATIKDNITTLDDNSWMYYEQYNYSLEMIDHESRKESPRLKHPDRRYCKGLAFTYLPLPDVATGLPVHIHGTFQLTDNRRSIWMALKDTEGQAQKWSEWNHLLLATAIPQLYARVLLRFAQLTTEMLEKIEHQRQQELLDNDRAEDLSRYVIDHYYDAWPDPNNVPLAFRPLLFELVRSVKNEKLIIREPQSLLTVSRRLATTALYLTAERNLFSEQHKCSKNNTKNLPPLKPTEANFLDLTDVESHVFLNREAYLYEAVAQCQLLGHPVVLVPESVKQLLLQFDESPQDNPAAQQLQQGNQEKSIGIRPSKTSSINNARHAQKRRFLNVPKCSSRAVGYVLVSVLDIFARVLLPHWASLPPQELVYVPHFTDLMLCVCKILGRGPDKYILRFRNLCSQLQFVPTRFPGVVYDETEPLPLKPPLGCFDPTLTHLKISQLSQPDTEFRSPDVLRVLRFWGLKQTLGWTEMAQEAMTRMCVGGGCRAGTSHAEAVFPSTSDITLDHSTS